MKKELVAFIKNSITNVVRKNKQNLELYENKLDFDLLSTPNKDIGDYALNIALKLSKELKKNPMLLADEIAKEISKLNTIVSKVEVAHPGFINFFMNNNFLISKLVNYVSTNNLTSFQNIKEPETVVVDYSSVNIAKQMHVGHLRSTIIGDVIARVLMACGDKVIRQNHLGDWGVPIAMVLWKALPVIKEVEKKSQDPIEVLSLSMLENFYKEATIECEKNFKATIECDELLKKLQNKDAEMLKYWKMITKISMKEVYRIYNELGVLLNEFDEAGESYYKDMLEDTVMELERLGLVTISQGAKCVFLDEFKAKDGSLLPIIIQKSDGNYNYETFDLAALRYRIRNLNADRIIYVTDSRQSLHFAQVFAVAKKAGWTNKNGREVKLEHVTFGSVLGEDHKPIKTRSGESVKLSELLEEAIQRAYKIVCDKNPNLSEIKKTSVAKAVGIGAIKYADLSQNRNNDYVFSFDKMLALNGNTAPYLQYAHARICSIFRKAQLDLTNFDPVSKKWQIQHEAERVLIFTILKYHDVIELVVKELRPHILCNYLFDLATNFTTFYDQCPVLNALDQNTKEFRLYLCKATKIVLEHGLNLLGISAPDEM